MRCSTTYFGRQYAKRTVVHFHSSLGYCFFQSFCPKTAKTKFYESPLEWDLIIQLVLMPFFSLFLDSLTHLLPFRAFVHMSFPQLEMQAISFSLKTAFRLRRELNTISCTSPLDIVLFIQGERKNKNLYHHLLTDTLFWDLICCFACTIDLLQVNSLTKIFVTFTFTRIHKIINKASAMKLQIYDPPNQCKWRKQHLAVKHELLQKVYWLEGFDDRERGKKREKNLF